MMRRFAWLYSVTFAFALVFFLGITGCSSNGTFAIPGEGEVIQKNLLTEYLNIARAYDDLKKYDKAVEYYEKALSVDKKGEFSNSILYSIGRCHAVSGKWSEALDVYESLLEKDSGNTNLKISIAYVYAMSGDLDKACSSYSEISKENPTDISLLKNYISVLLAADKTEEAKAQLSLLVERFPGDSSIKELEKKINESGGFSQEK